MEKPLMVISDIAVVLVVMYFNMNIPIKPESQIIVDMAMNGAGGYDFERKGHSKKA